MDVLHTGEDLAEDDNVLGEVDGIPSAGGGGVADVEPVPQGVLAQLHLQVEKGLVGHEGIAVLIGDLMMRKSKSNLLVSVF